MELDEIYNAQAEIDTLLAAIIEANQDFAEIYMEEMAAEEACGRPSIISPEPTAEEWALAKR